jgi:hypothetical protein
MSEPLKKLIDIAELPNLKVPDVDPDSCFGGGAARSANEIVWMITTFESPESKLPAEIEMLLPLPVSISADLLGTTFPAP